MKSYDSLQINFTPSNKTYDLITEIIGVKPTDKEFKKNKTRKSKYMDLSSN